MKADKEFYTRQLQSLLPDGAAWKAKSQGSTLRSLIESLGGALALPHNRGLDLVGEALPSATREMLTDWEKTAGLPDQCTANHATTLGERRNALVSKLTGAGGQSLGFFENLARTLGYTTQITEWRPFICGRSVTGQSDQLGSPKGRHAWSLRVKGPRVTWFRCGEGICGIDPLGKITRAEDLECLLHRLKPAQSHLTVGYQGV